MGYKLLTQDTKTMKGHKNEMDWSDVGVWHKATGDGGLCSDGVIHDYDDPWIAVVMNPAHAAIADPIMYETEREGKVVTDGLKCGCKRMRLIRKMELPDAPTVQRIAFGIYAALEVYHDPAFATWADKWLSGRDRSAYSADDAADAAHAAADAARAAERSQQRTWIEGRIGETLG